jgi:CRISPR-associated endonuclease/helicase Cas3
MYFLGRYKRNDITGEIKTQTVYEHLSGVAELCERFCEEFNSGYYGKILGYFHDIGKYSDKWQEYIRKCNDLIEHVSEEIKKIDHSSAGAVYLNEKYKDGLGLILGYCIAGHHGGLSNWMNEEGGEENQIMSLSDRLKRRDVMLESLKNVPEGVLKVLDTEMKNPNSGKMKKETLHMWIRMLFSALVDADCLDSERCVNPERFDNRGVECKFGEMRNKLETYIEELKEKNKGKASEKVNEIRNIVMKDCIESSVLEKGFYTLSVPTGGGKTLSSMMFGLLHAEKNGQKRIIYTIPYCSIIEQTAGIYRKIFGAENVIEHHVNIENGHNTLKNRLMSENWDAPIIVTTNVQFFQSLYGSKPSVCRKNHNIVNSVIVLDEAQMINPNFMYEIITVLKCLVEEYGCSVVFCSATQPDFYDGVGYNSNKIEGILSKDVTEIIKDKKFLYNSLNRVDFVKIEGELQYDEIAEKLSQHKQALCIVNTKRDCLEIYESLYGKSKGRELIHLSTNMCARDRADKINKIKILLSNNEDVIVISTQLIEAGVDIDFPIVYRAMSGLDSIAQAGGRCNRNGKMDKGTVYVFEIIDRPSPFGILKKGEDSTKNILKNMNIDIMPSTIKRYFRSFYNSINNFGKDFYDYNLVGGVDLFQFRFKDMADDFRLIENSTHPIVVRYKESGEIIEKMNKELEEKGFVSRYYMRQIQKYIVPVYDKTFDSLKEGEHLEEFEGMFILVKEDDYIEGIGILQVFDDFS